MKWCDFHHPDISWPVIRRRAGIEIVEMLGMASLFLSRGGWGLLNKSCYPNQAAYRNATSRLRKSGLVVSRSEAGQTPHLTLTDAALKDLPVYFTPEKMWNRKWNGIWYLLVYDVPEVDRKYRNVLRQFLKRMRMGCLQQSVWVTPQDIRPEFEDLAKVAGLDGFAFLFEAKTVLGLPSWRLVEEAWNYERLAQLQDRYCSVMEENIRRLERNAYSTEDLAILMRMAINAFHGVFVQDPLLPVSLHPATYRGVEVISLHRQLFEKINDHLEGMSSG